MLGKYPVISSGETIGQIEITQDGLFTVFEAKCSDQGEILRLSVYGQTEGYLGVMQPENGWLTLKKRLSRAALKEFPESIDYAGPAGGEIRKEPAEEEIQPEHELQAEPETEGADTTDAEEPAEQDTLWIRMSDGTLRSSGQGKDMLAVPLFPDEPLPNGEWERRTIEDTDYAVYDVSGGSVI